MTWTCPLQKFFNATALSGGRLLVQVPRRGADFEEGKFPLQRNLKIPPPHWYQLIMTPPLTVLKVNATIKCYSMRMFDHFRP